MLTRMADVTRLRERKECREEEADARHRTHGQQECERLGSLCCWLTGSTGEREERSSARGVQGRRGSAADPIGGSVLTRLACQNSLSSDEVIAVSVVASIDVMIIVRFYSVA